MILREINVESRRRRNPATNVASDVGSSCRRPLSTTPSSERGIGSGALLIEGAFVERFGEYRFTMVSIS